MFINAFFTRIVLALLFIQICCNAEDLAQQTAQQDESKEIQDSGEDYSSEEDEDIDGDNDDSEVSSEDDASEEAEEPDTMSGGTKTSRKIHKLIAKAKRTGSKSKMKEKENKPKEMFDAMYVLLKPGDVKKAGQSRARSSSYDRSESVDEKIVKKKKTRSKKTTRKSKKNKKRQKYQVGKDDQGEMYTLNKEDDSEQEKSVETFKKNRKNKKNLPNGTTNKSFLDDIVDQFERKFKYDPEYKDIGKKTSKRKKVNDETNGENANRTDENNSLNSENNKYIANIDVSLEDDDRILQMFERSSRFKGKSKNAIRSNVDPNIAVKDANTTVKQGILNSKAENNVGNVGNAVANRTNENNAGNIAKKEPSPKATNDVTDGKKSYVINYADQETPAKNAKNGRENGKADNGKRNGNADNAVKGNGKKPKHKENRKEKADLDAEGDDNKKVAKKDKKRERIDAMDSMEEASGRSLAKKKRKERRGRDMTDSREEVSNGKNVVHNLADDNSEDEPYEPSAERDRRSKKQKIRSRRVFKKTNTQLFRLGNQSPSSISKYSPGKAPDWDLNRYEVVQRPIRRKRGKK